MKATLPVFQLLILDDGEIPSTLPPYVVSNIASVKSASQGWPYRLLGGNEIREFLRSHFDGDVVAAYDGLKPHAYKADLARYCLLYLHGGLYVDLGIRLVQPLETGEGKSLTFFRDITSSSNTSWAVSNGLLQTQPLRREFQLAIELVVQNWRERHYGENALSPTGPDLLGRVLATVHKAEDYHCGEAKFLTPDHPRKNLGFVSPQGNIIAVRSKPAGDPYLGFPGSNLYSEMWRRRDVYAATSGTAS
jgi:Glycosyltransferase sugar-binding region containing DXD motif